MLKTACLSVAFLILSLSLVAQISISGIVSDSETHEPLPFVNIGIRHKNAGTSSLSDGRFSMIVPQQLQKDTLTFSMVGYAELQVPLAGFETGKQKMILLHAKATALKEISISAKKLTEKKIGIVRYNPLLHFTDGSVNQNDIFEIAQLMHLGTSVSKITSVNLYIPEAVKDSVTFRINFYAYSAGQPGERIVERNIIQTRQIREGWLTFDLATYSIYLKGDIIAAIEFIPGNKQSTPVYYEIKLGGTSRSYVRTSSLGEWRVPPHHYRMYVTALGTHDKKNGQQETEENETAATTRLFSSYVKDSFSVFVSLPPGYEKHKKVKYPTTYLLDANAYADIVSQSMQQLNANKQLSEMILIGIGYKDFLQMDSLRNRDYIFPAAPAADSFSTSGGGDKFLSFIEKELVPYIDRQYRTDTSNRTIMGHSLGGYFTLFALENELKRNDLLFKNYVAASPSLFYCNNYLLKEFQHVPVNTNNPYFLLLTTGSAEEGGHNNDDFLQLLKDQKFKNMRLQSEILPKYGHMETAVPTFEQGLRMIFPAKK